MKGILGRKIGMTQVFTTDGKLIPVTVIEATPNVVLQKKTVETDGYNAIQVGFEDKREKLANKPEKGVVAKANTAPKRFIKEFRYDEMMSYEVGQTVSVDSFVAGEVVDVTGTSKGKGYQGVIKRHGQHIGPKGHGSGAHRIVGSMGPIAPNRIAPGKNLPGQMGGNTRTVQNLEIVAVDAEKNVLLVSGSVPGPKKGLVIVKSGIKANGKTNEGELCLKGYYGWDFVHDTKILTPRLTQPMIRYKRGEPFTPVSWEEAISYTARRLSEIKEKYGNESIMVTGSSRGPGNEVNFVMQKFARAVLGNNNIDCCARV